MQFSKEDKVAFIKSVDLTQEPFEVKISDLGFAKVQPKHNKDGGVL